MQKQLESRLTELRAEFEKGQHRIKELEAESGSLRDTLLRISGAIQVLQEELEKIEQDNPKQK
jgi:predicted nuclease with TOPRIM domain